MNMLSNISFHFVKKSLIKTRIFSWHLLTFTRCSQIFVWMGQLTLVLTGFLKKRNEVKDMLKRYYKQVFILSVKSSFLFNGVYYKQIDGAAMGSPLGLTSAHLFLVYHERNWLESCPIQFQPKYYGRYNNDSTKIKVSKIMFNNNRNIQFTCEEESNDTISLLDISITRSNNKLVPSLY